MMKILNLIISCLFLAVNANCFSTMKYNGRRAAELNCGSRICYGLSARLKIPTKPLSIKEFRTVNSNEEQSFTSESLTPKTFGRVKYRNKLQVSSPNLMKTRYQAVGAMNIVSNLPPTSKQAIENDENHPKVAKILVKTFQKPNFLEVTVDRCMLDYLNKNKKSFITGKKYHSPRLTTVSSVVNPVKQEGVTKLNRKISHLKVNKPPTLAHNIIKVVPTQTTKKSVFDTKNVISFKQRVRVVKNEKNVSSTRKQVLVNKTPNRWLDMKTKKEKYFNL